jgi:hypothetical protein
MSFLCHVLNVKQHGNPALSQAIHYWKAIKWTAEAVQKEEQKTAGVSIYKTSQTALGVKILQLET